MCFRIETQNLNIISSIILFELRNTCDYCYIYLCNMVYTSNDFGWIGPRDNLVC